MPISPIPYPRAPAEPKVPPALSRRTEGCDVPHRQAHRCRRHKPTDFPFRTSAQVGLHPRSRRNNLDSLARAVHDFRSGCAITAFRGGTGLTWFIRAARRPACRRPDRSRHTRPARGRECLSQPKPALPGPHSTQPHVEFAQTGPPDKSGGKQVKFAEEFEKPPTEAGAQQFRRRRDWSRPGTNTGHEASRLFIGELHGNK